MAQNIYDDPEFFAGYSRLRRSVEGLDGAPEWPALRAMLPPLRGLRVVDLGCGFGWFCRWAREAGAAAVLGLDLSEAMLARARAATADAGVTYRAAPRGGRRAAPAPAPLAFPSPARVGGAPRGGPVPARPRRRRGGARGGAGRAPRTRAAPGAPWGAAGGGGRGGGAAAVVAVGK